MARLNLMGETAAVLAHELNQPLTATTNYLSAAQAMSEAPGAPASARITEILGRAVAQVQRATEILRRLRSFVEKGEPTKTAEDVAKLFEDAVALLAMRSEGLTVTTHPAPGLAQVVIDRVEIQQVLINLMRSAVEAMEASPRRELELSAIPSDGHSIQINVKDTGPGLSQDVAERLFQPFVSTKANGMGVGLSICRTIILRNGGRIWAEPSPGGGTIFSFTLPQTASPT
jgi:two-component system sensor kinase FixL